MPAPALARIQVANEREIDLHAQVKVLLVDDDQRWLDSARMYLEQDLGCRVDAVTHTEQAAHYLRQKSYQVVIADLNFDPPQTIQGNKFITDNIGYMGKAKVVAVTGQAYYAFKAMPELANLGVEIINKGEPNFLAEISSIAADKVEEQRQEVSDRLQAALGDIVPDVGIDIRTEGQLSNALSETPSRLFHKQPKASIQRLYCELEGALTSYLKSLPTADDKAIVIGGQHVSLNELIQHIEEGTDLGLAQMDTLIMQFKQVMGLHHEK